MLVAVAVAATTFACTDATQSVATDAHCDDTERICALTVTGPAGSRVALSRDMASAQHALRLTFAPLEWMPAQNAGGRPISATYALTIRGTTLAQPVEVAIPFDRSQITPGTHAVLLQSDLTPGSAWRAVADAEMHDGWMTTSVRSSRLYRVVAMRP